MKGNLHFELCSLLDDDSGMRVPENADYGYWPLMINSFLKTANRIEIHCWNGELEAMEELAPLLQKQAEELYTVFSGDLDAGLKQLLIGKYLDSSRRFKWFSIFLSSDETRIFNAEHWATEFFIPEISKEMELYIKKIMPADTSFHLYPEEF